MKYQLVAILLLLIVMAQDNIEKDNHQNLQLQDILSTQERQISDKVQSLVKDIQNTLANQKAKTETITPPIQQIPHAVQKQTNSQENINIVVQPSNEQYIKPDDYEIIKQSRSKESSPTIVQSKQKQITSIQQKNSKPLKIMIQTPEFKGKKEQQPGLIQKISQKDQQKKATLEPMEKISPKTREQELMTQIKQDKKVLKVNPLVKNNQEVEFSQKLVEVAKKDEQIPKERQLKTPLISSPELPVTKMEENQQYANKFQQPPIITTDYREYFPSNKAKTDSNLAMPRQIAAQKDVKLTNIKQMQQQEPVNLNEGPLPPQSKKFIKGQFDQQIAKTQQQTHLSSLPLTVKNKQQLSQKKVENILDKQQQNYFPVVKSKQINSLQISEQPIKEKEPRIKNSQILTDQLSSAKSIPINNINNKQKVNKQILDLDRQENKINKQNVVRQKISNIDLPIVSNKPRDQNLINMEKEEIKQTPFVKEKVVELGKKKKIVMTPDQEQSPKIIKDKQISLQAKSVQSQLSTNPKMEENQQYDNKIQEPHITVTDYREYFPSNKANKAKNDISLKTSTQIIAQKDIKLAKQENIIQQVEEPITTNRVIKSTIESQKQINPTILTKQQTERPLIKRNQVEQSPLLITNQVKGAIPQNTLKQKQIGTLLQEKKPVRQYFVQPIPGSQNYINIPSQTSVTKVKQPQSYKLIQNQQVQKIDLVNQGKKVRQESQSIVKDRDISKNNGIKQININKIVTQTEQGSHQNAQRIESLENKLKELMDMLERQKDKQKINKPEQIQKVVSKNQNRQQMDSIPQIQYANEISRQSAREESQRIQRANLQDLTPSIQKTDEIKLPLLGQNSKIELDLVPTKTVDIPEMTSSIQNGKALSSTILKKDSVENTPQISETNIIQTNLIKQNSPMQNIIQEDISVEVPNINLNERNSQLLKDYTILTTAQTQKTSEKALKADTNEIPLSKLNDNSIKTIDIKQVKPDKILQDFIKQKASIVEVPPINQYVDTNKEIFTSIKTDSTDPIAIIPLKQSVNKVQQSPQKSNIEQIQPITDIIKKEVQASVPTKASNQENVEQKKVQQQSNKNIQLEQRPYNAYQTQTNKEEKHKYKKKSNINAQQYQIDNQNQQKHNNQKLKRKQKKQLKKNKKSLRSIQQQKSSYDVLQQYRKLQHKKQSLKSQSNAQSILNQPKKQNVEIHPPAVKVKSIFISTNQMIIFLSLLAILVVRIIYKYLQQNRIANEKLNRTQPVKQQQDFSKLSVQTGLEVADRLEDGQEQH